MPPLLALNRLTVSFPARDGQCLLAAVREVSLTLASGEVLGLVGESGSGKSATALAIMRLLPSEARVEGQLQFDGRDLLSASDDQMREIRGARMAMIFQEPMTALNPVMRVGDQIAEAVLAHSGSGYAQHHAAERLRSQGDAEVVSAFRPSPAGRALGRLTGLGVEAKLTKAGAWKLAVEAMH